MGTKRCLACADLFQSCPQVPSQNYCSRRECQRERRKLWQREKRRTDADYLGTQNECQRRWRDGHADYWRAYRAEHPEYAGANREKQRSRNAMRQRDVIAKMDECTPTFPLASGTYRLSRPSDGGLAKMDEWIVEITVLATTCGR